MDANGLSDLERIVGIRIRTVATTTREYKAIQIFIGGAYYSKDWVSDSDVRLAKRLADNHGAPFQVSPELSEGVSMALGDSA